MSSVKTSKRSKANKRVIFGFLILISVFAISEFVSFRNLNKSKEISSRNSTLLQPSIILLNELQLMIVNSEDYADSWVFFDISDHPDKLMLKELNESGFDKLIGDLRSLSQRWDNKVAKNRLEQIFKSIDTIRSEQTWIMENLNGIDDYSNVLLYVEAESTHLENIKSLSSDVKEDLKFIITWFKDLSSKEEKSAQNSFKFIRTAHLVLAIIAFVIAVLVSWATIRAARLEEQKQVISEERDRIHTQKALIEEKNKEILSSITYAKRLQSSMLPASVQFESSFDDHFVFYKPRDIVSGDFYWLRKVENPDGECLFVAAADATGHGVPGAFVSFVCYSSLNRSMDEFELSSPAAILDKTAELVSNTFSLNSSEDGLSDGMDIALCMFDLNKRILRFSGAFNPAWVVRNGEALQIEADRKSVGKDYSMQNFTDRTFDLLPGDSIYICSDGFADQFGGSRNRKFKMKNLVTLFVEIADKSMAEQRLILDRTFTDWQGENEQVDDVLIIGMRV